MKLHLSTTVGTNMITGYGADHVLVNNRSYSKSLVILPRHLIEDWPVARFEDLDESHFLALAEHGPSLVLLGTGARQRFPQPRLYASLLALRIGVEIMDIGAACRTYNILAAEGRQVAAAILIETAQPFQSA